MQNPDVNMNRLEIIKLEVNHILMRHKDSRRIFRYVESIETRKSIGSQCSHIVLPFPIETGYLFETGLMTLTAHINSKTRNWERCKYEEDELVNTIEPLLRALQTIHNSGQIHGSISPESIIISEMGELRLYFPGIKQFSSFYYASSGSFQRQQDDYRAIGLILLELLGYERPCSDEEIKIVRLIAKEHKFGDVFLLCLLSMLQKKTIYLQEALSKFLAMCEKDDPQILSEDAKNYLELELEEDKKKVEIQKRMVDKVEFTPPLIKYGDYTPKKTLQITRKYMKTEDAENKKIFEDSKKKKPVEQTLKKVSNGKGQGQNSGNVVSSNYKKILRDIRETKEREDLFKMAIVKRMRTLSKKKNG